MPARQDDDLAWPADRPGSTSGGSSVATSPASAASRAATSPSRSLALGGAVALAVVATLVAVLISDLSLLRGCVVLAAWVVVGAAYVAVRQTAERQAAAARERELRRAYDRELDLADASRREYELGLENDLRREADEALREELGRLRGQSAELTRLREQLARVSGLGDSLAGLAQLREDVAALGALRADVAALSRLHEDVGQLGELRDELAALRAELTDPAEAEMLVERILLRTRGFRTADRSAAAEQPGAAPVAWTDEPPRELTGGWPAVRLDQAPATREYEPLARERTWEPATVEWSAAAADPVADDRRADLYEDRYGSSSDQRGWDPLSDPLPEGYADGRAAPRHGGAGYGATRYDDTRYDDTRHEPSAWRDELQDEPAAPTPPLEWLADHALLDPLDQPWTTPTRAAPVAGATAPPPEPAELPASDTGPVDAQSARPVPFRRRRADEAGGPPTDPGHAATTEHPAHRAGVRPPLPSYGATAPPQPDTAGHTQLSEIIGGATPAAGGRRRRRYREDDDADDVLSRVLRGE